MCGIAGYTGHPLDEGQLLRQMMDRIAHRGPDDEGVYIDAGISLGHKRLTIIDLVTGQQPMHSVSGRYVLAYNGELYNYRELRARLQSTGISFTSSSDTEVLLNWLITYGEGGIQAFNGMFAFAFWDKHEHTLLLGRDRLGIKPLYYCQMQNGRLAFASEIKAILPLLSRVEADHHTIYEFLTFQNILSQNTFFKNIQKLPPGEYLKWSPEGSVQKKYWEIDFSEDYRGSYQDALEEYSAVLHKAVERHMIADVPLGAYLSGGIDSSTVATLASELTAQPMNTFTGAFTDGAYFDERSGSREVARSIQANAHEIEITPQHYIDHIQKTIYHLDEPTLGTGAFPQYMVSGLVSKHVKVVLTGHGGDEMFAGYQVNKVALLQETMRKNPAKIPSVLLGIKPDEWSRVLYFALFSLIQPEVNGTLFVMVPRRQRSAYFSQDFLQSNRDFDPFDYLSSYIYPTDTPGQRILRFYLKTYLPTLFMQEDKVSMAHSIEARTPLCDNELVDLAMKFPLNIKLHGNQLKAITRDAMKTKLPEKLYHLPKRGFPTPFALWYRREPLRSFMEDILFDSKTKTRNLFNFKKLEKSYRSNLHSKSTSLFDYATANKLYSFCAVELWFRTFID